MPASTALMEFENALALAQSLVDIERDTCHNPPRADEQAQALALRGGATVLMVAAFERFMRDMMVERIDELMHTRPRFPLTSLPDKMRVHHVYASLELAMKGRPYEPSRDRINRLDGIDLACRYIIGDQLNSEVFGETGANPSSTTLRAMYKKIGVENLFAWIRPEFDRAWRKSESIRFVEDKLDEIVEKRHLVAHTADALNISRSDLNLWLKFLRLFAEALDTQTEQYIQNLVSP